MRRLAWFVGGVALLGGLGCNTDIQPADRPAYWNGVNSLTLMLYDGLTGAPVTSAKVGMQIGASRVEAKQADGGNIYTLAQLPPGTFPLFIDASGYLAFVGQYTLTGSGSLSSATPGFTYSTATAILYPEESVDDDVTVSVYDGDGAPVASGKVVATLDPSATIQTIVGDVASPLDGQIGLMPASVVSSLSDGKVTLPHAQLVLGAVYKIDVISARDAEGRYLQPVQDLTFRAGIDLPELVTFMGPPAQCPLALSATNEDGGTQPSLSVTFPYAIETCNEPDDLAWTNITDDGTAGSADTDGDGVIATPDDDAPVTVSLSSDDTVLTATANLETQPSSTDDPDDTLRLTFSGIQVRVKGSLTCIDLDSIPLRHAAAGAAPTCSASGPKVSETITVREHTN